MKPIRFPRGRQLRAVFIIAALAAGVLWVGRVLQDKGLDWATDVSSVVSMFLAAVALLMPLFTQLVNWLYGPRPVVREQLGTAAEELATALSWEWEEEERLRRIYDPRPLPVRWEVTSSASAATATGAGLTSDLRRPRRAVYRALRQDGATYQFRHIRLQERLAETHPGLIDRVDDRFQQEATRILQARWPQLFASNEQLAQQNGWQVSLDQRRMVIAYRDSRFDQFIGQPEWYPPGLLPEEALGLVGSDEPDPDF